MAGKTCTVQVIIISEEEREKGIIKNIGSGTRCKKNKPNYSKLDFTFL